MINAVHKNYVLSVYIFIWKNHRILGWALKNNFGGGLSFELLKCLYHGYALGMISFPLIIKHSKTDGKVWPKAKY